MLEELVEKVKNGDKAAFATLINILEKQLYSIAILRLKNIDDVGDAIQETIYKSYKNIKKLKNNSLFKPWIIKILINECNIIYRKNSKYIISYDENQLENYILAENNDNNIEFDILIKSLNDEEKMIFTLYYKLKYTLDEISIIMKMNKNTIKSKIARAKMKLKNKINKEDEIYE